MLFAWLRRRRRSKILASPFPPAWAEILESIPHVANLPKNVRQRHQNLTQIFVAEKTLEGCGGLEITDEVRVTIAGLASILVLGMSEYVFDNVYTILVYPDAFAVKQQVSIGAETHLEEESERLGEAHYRGPVILAWAEIEEDIREPGFGRNLVFHEFAHQLDMLNGAADGVPNLPRELQKPWEKVMAKEYRRLRKSTRRHHESLIDSYGASEPAEFFAVVTETFFDNPGDLSIEHPELFDLLCRYYGQMPSVRS